MLKLTCDQAFYLYEVVEVGMVQGEEHAQGCEARAARVAAISEAAPVLRQKPHRLGIRNPGVCPQPVNQWMALILASGEIAR
ncbi:hypothetical protein, partial [Escherichia coli]|uniref:hypothetical protein n=1 Tax=Escherichia coli TaxID=562 RepID=UPI0039E1C84F